MNSKDDKNQSTASGCCASEPSASACCEPAVSVDKQACCPPEPVSKAQASSAASCCGESTAEPMAISVNADGTAACCGPDVIVDEASCGTTSCCDGKPEPSGINRLWSYLTTVWALIALIPLTVLVLDPDNIGQVLSIGASAFGGTLPYIVIAVLMIGYLKATGAENIVARAFEGREYRMIVFAALFGGLAPFCSCEVIPFVAGLLAVGAPLSAVMAFWLSSPLIDPPSLMITAAALGWDFAIGKAVAAVALGLFGGFGVKLLLLSGPFSSPLKAERAPACSSGTCGVDEPFAKQAVWKFWKEPERVSTFRDESLSNAVFLIKWLMLAYLIEALLILYVPASVIGTAVGGDGFWPIVMGALVGMPAYLNSYAAPPLIAGLMEQGMSAGSAMAFMVAGAISSIPAMAAVWSLVKKPVFAAYLGFGVSGAVLFGALFAALMA